MQTGQHHEVPLNGGEVSSQITSPLGFIDDMILFSFDTWRRGASGINWWVEMNSPGNYIAQGTHIYTSNNWELVTTGPISVTGANEFRVSFQSVGGGSSGAHVDQVSLALVPEPSVLALFGLGLIGLGFAGRRKV